MFKRHQMFKGQREMQEDRQNKERSIRNVFTEKDKHLSDFINSDPDFAYIYKKTERLIMATYMVTDILSDTDPLKNHVREKALGLLSATLFLKDGLSTDSTLNGFHETVLRIVSLLDVAFVTGRITEMNATVLKREFGSLLEYVNSASRKKKESPGRSSFSRSFFDVELPERRREADPAGLRTSVNDPSSSASKSFIPQQPELSSDRSSDEAPLKKRSHGRPSGYIGNVAKNERRAAIFNLLREKKEITVRDLATVVTDCSEKTLQRELLQLVEEGILNKEGERRWSRYSLVI